MSYAGFLLWACAGRTPITMYRDRFFVNGELWQYWREAFPHRSVLEMFNFVKCDIDDEHAAFTRSLDWQGPQPSV